MMVRMDNTEFRNKIEQVGSVVGAVIKKDGLYLLVQQGQGDVEGLWNIPAGYVDKGESLQQAVVREAKEESGYNIEVGEPLGVWHTSSTESVKHAFVGTVRSGEPLAQQGEIQKVSWVSYEDVVALSKAGKFRAPWIVEAISTYEQKSTEVSPKQRHFLAVFFLSFMWGTFGVDRFYLGKVWTGLLKLVTFGGLGFWTLIDFVLIMSGAMKDKQGNPMRDVARYKKFAAKTVLFFALILGLTVLLTGASLIYIVFTLITGFMDGGGFQGILPSIPGVTDSPVFEQFNQIQDLQNIDTTIGL